MPDVTILTEADLRTCVSLDHEAVAVVETAFATLARGGAVMPPILSMAIPEKHGEVDVKTAYVSSLPAFAIKVSPGFFDNPKRGLPSLNGLMMVFEADTGLLQAILLDNGYLTNVRTAAAGAGAAKHLAPEVVQTAAVLGAGLQAELQVRALMLVRRVDRVLVWARDGDKGSACAGRIAAATGVPTKYVATVREAVERAQCVITTTPAEDPLIMADWLHPGLHVTSMGSDAANKNELDPAVIRQADRFVCDRVSQSASVGELRAAIAAGLVAADVQPDELGAICAGLRPGRLSATEVTVCDLTGTGVQDTAIAAHAVLRSRANKLGHVVRS